MTPVFSVVANAPVAPAGSAERNEVRLREGWFRVLIVLAAVGLLLRHAAHATAADADMFHELALFREALASGWIPYADPFAYTPTVYPVVHHEWGTGAVLYLFAVVTGWGNAGIMLLHFLLLGGTAVGAWTVATRRGGHPLVCALLVGLAGSLFAPGLSPVRAQMFTYLMLVVMLLILPLHERRGVRFLLLWLPLYVLWLNLHGGFVVGLGLFAAFTAERLVRSTVELRDWRAAASQHGALLVALPAMAALILVNPYGLHYPPFVWSAVRLDRPLIAEWAPLWDPRVHPVLLAAFGVSLALVLYAVLRGRGRDRLDGLPMLALAAAMTVQHQRLAPVYALLWFCFVPGWLAQSPLEQMLLRFASRYRAVIAGLALAAAAAGVADAVRARSWQLVLPDAPGPDAFHFPVGAVRHLRDIDFRGNVMTPFNTGAYVSWELYPRVRVSMDSRYEVAYPPGSVEENVDFYAARPGWQSMLGRYDTDAVLVPVDAPLDAAMRAAQQQTGWRETYRDAGYALYMRSQ